MNSQKYLVLIVGPTAVGKTSLCIELAKKLKAEIFSCDSRQFYKEISIGTAKPSLKELSTVKHHFINNKSITEDYTVADFESEMLFELEKYFQERSIAILTGGSGLFAKAITHGFDEIPDIPQVLRTELTNRLETEGLSALQEQLQGLDPEIAKEIDLNNSQRVIRALEICMHTGKPYSAFRAGKQKKRSFEIIKIALDRPRKELYDRINRRVDLMLAEGLLMEANSVKPFRHKNALQTVGYKEAFAFLDGQIDEKEMENLIKQNTRRYAKRQLTWFRNQDTFRWFHPDNQKEIADFIEISQSK